MMNHYFKIFISSILILFSVTVKASITPIEIKGIIKDSVTNQNIEYATIALYNKIDSTLITGTISDSEGNFVLQKIFYGTYFIEITSLGYQEVVIDLISIDENTKAIDIGEILLSVASQQIDEVVVSAEKRAIEYHINKDVINVEQSSNNTGGMAADVLENHPSIESGIDGTIKLRGSTNFIVLVNGKPSSDESTDILNQIPASSIDKIEIITNPSAKYDANHAAGIVNLITQKSEFNGFSGTTNVSVSNAERYNADLSMNYRTKKTNISIHSGMYHSPIFQDRSSVEHRIVDGDNGFQNFHSDNILLWEGKNINVSADYYVSDKNTIAFYLNRSSSTFGWSPQKTISEGIAADTSFYFLDDYMRNYRDAWHYNVSDIHKFDDKGHELRFDANIIVVDMSRKNNQYLHQSNNSWAIEDLQEEYHLRRFQNITRQQYRADYTLPFHDNTKLESGLIVKIDDRTIQNDIVTLLMPDDYELPNTDKYKSYNNLYAAYSSLNQNILKNDLQVGLRVEYLNRNTILINSNFKNKFNQLDFFPNFNLSRQLTNNSKMRFGYSRSVWRPTDLQLNPTIYFRDISGEFSGNAELKPSYTNSIELNYNLLFNNHSISVTGFYKKMKNNIMTIRYLNENSIYHNNPENLQGNQQDLGIELAGTLNVCNWLSLNPSGNFYNGYINGKVTEQEINRRGNVWSARVIANIKPFANTQIQANTYYNSPTLGDQVYMKAIYGLNFSIKHSLFNNKLIVSLAGDDILQTEKRKFIVKGESFKQSITDVFPKHPIYTLNLTFKLNNYNRKQKEDIEQGIGFF